MSDGSEFQVRGAATENARRANSLRVLGTVSSRASDDRRGRTGTAVWIRSLKYAGVAEDIVLKPRPHQQQCRTSFALKFRPFDKVERCFDIVASVDRALVD